jgi:hypothetical protein
MYPRDRRIVANATETKNPCSITLRPRDFDRRMAEWDVDVYTLIIESGRGGFEEGAAAAGFDMIEPDSSMADFTSSESEHAGEWVIYGRHGQITTAEPFSVGAYSGLRGYSVSGCYHDGDGVYAGLCDLPMAFLTDGRRWVSVNAGPQSDVLEIILNSVCLEAPPDAGTQ